MSKTKHIAHEVTGSFSKLVMEYLRGDEKLKDFVTDFPSVESIKKQIKLREQKPADRAALTAVLTEQYTNNQIQLEGTKIGEAILKLKDEKTFTICSAHQPNIFTGYLYTIYKIIHTINLAKACEENIPGYQFVPLFFIGSEDNDIEEIGTIHFKNKKYQWKPNVTGACGRITTQSLVEIRDAIVKQLGNSEHEKILAAQLVEAYDGRRTLTEATQHFLHSLFGAYGLLALDADDTRLKKAFQYIIKDELENQTSHRIVIEHNNKLAKNYKIQVDPRELNLFYLKDNVRERIEKSKTGWKVINNSVEFRDSSLVEQHPEYFSPNVILRPLYQETILPNVAFVGGGSEIAYWMELQSLFENYQVPFPILFVRNSVSVVSEKIFDKMDKIGFEESFKPLELALKEKAVDDPAYIQLVKDLDEIEKKYRQAIKSAEEISPNLLVSAEAQLAKIEKLHDRIKTKYRAHIKREFQDLGELKVQLSSALFPNDRLQERQENYLELLSRYKIDFIPILLSSQQAFGNEYLIIGV